MAHGAVAVVCRDGTVRLSLDDLPYQLREAAVEAVEEPDGGFTVTLASGQRFRWLADGRFHSAGQAGSPACDRVSRAAGYELPGPLAAELTRRHMTAWRAERHPGTGRLASAGGDGVVAVWESESRPVVQAAYPAPAAVSRVRWLGPNRLAVGLVTGDMLTLALAEPRAGRKELTSDRGHPDARTPTPAEPDTPA